MDKTIKFLIKIKRVDLEEKYPTSNCREGRKREKLNNVQKKNPVYLKNDSPSSIERFRRNRRNRLLTIRVKQREQRGERRRRRRRRVRQERERERGSSPSYRLMVCSRIGLVDHRLNWVSVQSPANTSSTTTRGPWIVWRGGGNRVVFEKRNYPSTPVFSIRMTNFLTL